MTKFSKQFLSIAGALITTSIIFFTMNNNGLSSWNNGTLTSGQVAQPILTFGAIFFVLYVLIHLFVNREKNIDSFNSFSLGPLSFAQVQRNMKVALKRKNFPKELSRMNQKKQWVKGDATFNGVSILRGIQATWYLKDILSKPELTDFSRSYSMGDNIPSFGKAYDYEETGSHIELLIKKEANKPVVKININRGEYKFNSTPSELHDFLNGSVLNIANKIFK